MRVGSGCLGGSQASASPGAQVTETRDCLDYSSPLVINHCLLSRLTEMRLMREVLGQYKGWVEGTRGQVVNSFIPLVARKILKETEAT